MVRQPPIFIAFVRRSFADGARTLEGGIRFPPVLIEVYGGEDICEFSLGSLAGVRSQVGVTLKTLLVEEGNEVVATVSLASQWDTRGCFENSMREALGAESKTPLVPPV